ncbi:MAG TPA: hypothetical protein VJU34_13610, partial [Phenylobacterium sp.]|nr:hypothetical protein [Phenylobacterium sp.]
TWGMLLFCEWPAPESGPTRRRKLQMAFREPVHHGSKTLAEGAFCFGCALAALAGAAVALQWAIGFLI